MAAVPTIFPNFYLMQSNLEIRMKPYGTVPSYRKGYCRVGKRGRNAALDSADERNQRAAAISRRARAKQMAEQAIKDGLLSLDD